MSGPKRCGRMTCKMLMMLACHAQTYKILLPIIPIGGREYFSMVKKSSSHIIRDEILDVLKFGIFILMKDRMAWEESFFK